VTSAQDLTKAVEIRSNAYSRHVPAVGKVLRIAEADDYRQDVLSIFAERKADGRALGSVRLQSNLSQPLRIEGETTLPAHYQGKRLVEFMRLGVENGIAGQMVSAALVKAGFKPSLYHADPVVGENRPFADQANGVHFFDRLAVLRHAGMPAVLFEAGVIVNRDEELQMRDAEVRKRIAASVVQGVGECLTKGSQ